MLSSVNTFRSATAHTLVFVFQDGKSLLMQASECSILALLLEHETPLNLQDKVSVCD